MTRKDPHTQDTDKAPDPPGAVSNQNGEEAETPHRDHPEVSQNKNRGSGDKHRDDG